MAWTDRLSALALSRRSRVARYAITVAIFGICVAARFALAPWLIQATFLVFFPGIALATLLSGWRQGIALLVAFGFVVGYAIMSPPFSLSLDDGASALQLVLYFAVGGLIVFLLASLLDLLRRLEAETELRQTLFHELRHRVANNMQVVALSLHNARRAVSDPAALQAIDETSARVAALGALHRRLYDSAAYQSGLATILGDALSETLRGLPVDIRINIDAGDLSIDQMTAILLLVNEAAMNAAKHVYRPGRGRVFEVSLVDNGAGRLCLVVLDDGPGMGMKPGQSLSEGQGMRIMQGFARQLGGSLEVSSGRGAMLSVDFPRESRPV